MQCVRTHQPIIINKSMANKQTMLPKCIKGPISTSTHIHIHLARKQNRLNDLFRCKIQTMKMNHGHLRHERSIIILITVPEHGRIIIIIVVDTNYICQHVRETSSKKWWGSRAFKNHIYKPLTTKFRSHLNRTLPTVVQEVYSFHSTNENNFFAMKVSTNPE